MALTQYDWIFALITIAFAFSAFGNGANDVANSYATSVAARTLTMPQVGFLSMTTEFVGAVALGKRVTGTIKNDIIDIERFANRPGVLILAMACAEVGSATWLMIATSQGFRKLSKPYQYCGPLLTAFTNSRINYSNDRWCTRRCRVCIAGQHQVGMGYGWLQYLPDCGLLGHCASGGRLLCCHHLRYPEALGKSRMCNADRL